MSIFVSNPHPGRIRQAYIYTFILRKQIASPYPTKKKLEREMRSMKGEVVLNIPAEKAWEMYMDDGIISKINPEMLAAAEYLQGDGSPESVRLFKLGPG